MTTLDPGKRRVDQATGFAVNPGGWAGLIPEGRQALEARA